MANVLSTDRQAGIIGALCEGSSIRSIERMTGVHRDTIMRLGVRVGQGCMALMDAKMRHLSCTRLEMDEIWGFIGKKQISAPDFVSSEKIVVIGNPDSDLISTSYVERLNATTRLHMRRLTRLTLAFSKKLDNFEAAVGLHFAYYNFVKRHGTVKCTPAMAAGVTATQWSVEDLVRAA
jgi:hypothetical protein